MKAEMPLRPGHRARKSNMTQRQRTLMSQEQTASTSSERSWVVIILALIILMAGLYTYRQEQGEQPGRSGQGVVNAYAADERPVLTIIDEPSLTGPEALTSRGPEAPTPIAHTTWSPNERLVRRFYDEVLNHQQFAVIDELFAHHVAYGYDRPLALLSRTDLKAQIDRENNDYTGLTYTIEQITSRGKSVWIDWSASGTPLIWSPADPTSAEAQFWSGHTIWRIINGKIVQMWTSNTDRYMTYQPKYNQAVQFGQLYTIEDVADYQRYLSDR